MKLNDEKKTQAEYDRFVDFMAQMYLKYGTKYAKDGRGYETFS